MASERLALASNVEGDFFVDDTCIDCAACRWIAPASFDEDAEYSRVYQQPDGSDEVRRAQMALLACPTGSIGTRSRHDLAEARASFPDPIRERIYHCGYHHRGSYGAASYLLVHPDGNILIDSPRFTRALVKSLEALGGVDKMFLTHRDDVADHARFAEHFGCERILHADDVGRRTKGVETQIVGRDPVALADDLIILPTPGHTRGSAVLLYGDQVCFSGDHVFWSPRWEQLYASRSVCWYDWGEQTDSMKRLAEYRFESLLPGHGHPIHLSAEDMADQMGRLLHRMERQ